MKISIPISQTIPHQYKAPEWVKGMTPKIKADKWAIYEILGSNIFLMDPIAKDLIYLVNLGKTKKLGSRLSLEKMKRHPFMWSTQKIMKEK